MEALPSTASTMEKFYHEGSRSLFVQICALSNTERGVDYTGVILFCQPEFAYIIAHIDCVNGATSPDCVEVTFADGSVVLVPFESIKSCGQHFIVFDCVPENSFDTTVVKAVEFDEKKLAREQKVYTLCLLDYSRDVDLTSGGVSKTEDLFFFHNCRAGSFTKDGSPIFNTEAQFVGLCYGQPCGLLAASTVCSIARDLSHLHGTTHMGINEILQHIYSANVHKNDPRGIHWSRPREQYKRDGCRFSKNYDRQEAAGHTSS